MQVPQGARGLFARASQLRLVFHVTWHEHKDVAEATREAGPLSEAMFGGGDGGCDRGATCFMEQGQVPVAALECAPIRGSDPAALAAEFGLGATNDTGVPGGGFGGDTGVGGASGNTSGTGGAAGETTVEAAVAADDDSSSAGMIAGVVAALLVCCLVAAAAAIAYRRKQASAETAAASGRGAVGAGAL